MCRFRTFYKNLKKAISAQSAEKAKRSFSGKRFTPAELFMAECLPVRCGYRAMHRNDKTAAT